MSRGILGGRIILAGAIALITVLSACAPLPQPSVASDSLPSVNSWSVSVVDPSGGWHSSIAADSAGRPHIVYLGGTDELRYAWWDGLIWRFERVDAWSENAYKASLALDSGDVPHVAYFDRANWDLKYATRINGTWVVEVVDEYGDVGRQPSIAIDSRDRPHISYYNISNPSLYCTVKYAAKNGSSWDIETVADAGTFDIGDADTSLALNSTDDPRIAYGANQIVDYAYKEASGWKLEPIYGNPGDNRDNHYPSMALDSNEIPHIVYSRSSTADILEHAQRTPLGWVVEDVDPAGGYYHAVAIDSKDKTHIAYTNSLTGVTPWYLYYASHDLSWILDTIDIQEMVRGSLSIAVDGCDGIHISFTRNYTGGTQLRYAYLPDQDVTSPRSAASSPSPYWRNVSPVTVEAVVSDSCSGVSNVTLWIRHSMDNTTTWSAWTRYSTVYAPPWAWSFTFPDGEGYYELYTTAIDNVGNAEPPPPNADAITGYDITPPVSAAMPISPYWHTAPSLTVNATATDNLSGVANVALLYSHAPLNNASWSPWIPFGTKTSAPWSWSFPFPDGEGNYIFHTIATDNATNVEGSKTVAEAIAGYMTPPDYVPVNPQPPSPQTIGLSLPLQLSIEVRNQGGNASTSSTLSFFDSLAPTMPFASFQVPPVPADGTSGPFTATWTSPATRCSCTVSTSVDSDDNVTESNESNNVYAWMINVVPGPVTSLVVGNPNYTSAAAYIKSSTPLDLSVMDQSMTGIKRTKFRTDNGTWIDYASSFFLNGDGDHYVEWYSEDNAGNVESMNTRVLGVDDVPPATSLSIGQPKYLVGGRFVNSSTPLTLSAVDGGVGSNSTFYRLWDGTWTQWREYSTTFNLAGRDGTWYVEFLSFDYLGNMEALQNETLILDDTPPVTTISPAVPFTLAATDSGCGLNVTMYRIDSGSWTVYTGNFALSEGEHTIYYYSIDNLGNVEQERSLVVRPPVEVEVNYKPIVALIFAVILLVAGVWSSKRRPWKGGKDSTAVVKALIFTSMPFVAAEAATGVISFLTGELSIPPVVGVGMAVDCTILILGLVVLVARAMKKKTGTEEAPAI